jgi:hypothetical protein
MTPPKRRSIQIDDPLAPQTGPASAARQSPSRAMLVQISDGIWRNWSGVTGVGSFRLPHELLTELGDTARELQLPIGMIVTAAVTKLLDQPPDTIVTLVDRADDARIQGRRQTRRHRQSGPAPLQRPGPDTEGDDPFDASPT